MNLQFIKNSKKFFILSIVLMVVIIAACFVKGVEFDIQFKGGALVTYAYEGTLSQEQVKQALDGKTAENTSIQFGDDLATGQNTIVLSLPGSISAEEMIALSDGLIASFPENNITELQTSNVDPTIGREFLLKAVIAVALASVALVVYTAFRFRRIGGWSAGVMALVALFHDIMVAFGAFVILGIPINDNFIAVILTILGFSLNDTIVIYDRIRENQKLMPSEPLPELVNHSINQSFTRSVFTAMCAVLTMVVVTIVALITNVDSILSFSIPMLVGLISGSYSSVCLVGPLWVKWKTRKAK